MTKANMMKEAHRKAKTYEGDYTACLALALRELNEESEGTELERLEKEVKEVEADEFGIHAYNFENNLYTCTINYFIDKKVHELGVYKIEGTDEEDVEDLIYDILEGVK